MLGKHEVGDLVIRYYFQANILGYIKKIREVTSITWRYEIEWMNPPDGAHTSIYSLYEITEAKRRLNAYLEAECESQNRRSSL
jgi:hypothetical protein